MGLKNIEKYSFRFYLLKFLVKIWHDNFFYKKVAYVNRDNVPKNEHLIFTANHQNALMDALAIEINLCLSPVLTSSKRSSSLPCYTF